MTKLNRNQYRPPIMNLRPFRNSRFYTGKPAPWTDLFDRHMWTRPEGERGYIAQRLTKRFSLDVT
jgi:hypothetical protein